MLPDCSIAEVHCSHFLEHLEHNQRHPERARFMNELWRVLIPGGLATIITPYWASSLAYGDFTHADKPVTEMFYSYLDQQWRQEQAPDNDIEYNADGYSCDFENELGHRLHPHFAERPREEQEFALQWYKDAVLELHARLIARKTPA
jgi:SAM-dependent methyltransferase